MRRSAIDRSLPTLAPMFRQGTRPIVAAGRRLGRVRLSVRMLMAVVLVVGGGLGRIIQDVRTQRDAVAAIRDKGGAVVYDVEWKYATPNPYAGWWSPVRWLDGDSKARDWLADRVGIDAFGTVVHVSLNRPEVDDATMARVGRLRRLRGLELVGADVTDAGLALLEALDRLGYLNLNGTRVSDAGLVHLEGLDDLRTLCLFQTRVGDVGERRLNRILPLVQIFRNPPPGPTTRPGSNATGSGASPASPPTMP